MKIRLNNLDILSKVAMDSIVAIVAMVICRLQQQQQQY